MVVMVVVVRGSALHTIPPPLTHCRPSTIALRSLVLSRAFLGHARTLQSVVWHLEGGEKPRGEWEDTEVREEGEKGGRETRREETERKVSWNRMEGISIRRREVAVESGEVPEEEWEKERETEEEGRAKE